MASKSKSAQAVVSKYDKITEGFGIWGSYYRANPHKLAVDYLGLVWLRLFQQILIFLCFRFTYVMIIASRGMGKSLIAAIVCCLKCIMYPGIKICIAAGKRGQSVNVLNKIVEDLMPRSHNLCNEIADHKEVPSDAFIIFKNGSTIKVVTASDTARSARAHLILADEFVQIKKTILDKVIRKFKAGQRTPNFYNRPEYKNYPKEPNTEIYISSAYFKYHYSWAKFKSFFKSMLKEESYVALGFPYQLPVREGYYPAEQIREEQQEDDYDSVAWSMEMESLFWGQSENAFFSFDDLDASRVILKPLYPLPLYAPLGDPKIKYQPKINGEIRLIGMDIATQGGNKNDATCFVLLQMLPLGNSQFVRNVLYMETLDGGHTYNQAIRLRQLYDDFEADYVIVDTNGVGIGVFDNLVQDQIDEDRSLTYPAWTCVNDPKMAERSKNQNGQKVIYSIKASAQFNSDCAVMLRDGIKRKKVRLLVSEADGNDWLGKSKNYNTMTAEAQLDYQIPFYQTTAFINEAVNLDYEVINGKIKVKEVQNMRKDRYSSLSYTNYIATEIERDIRNSDTGEFDFSKAPTCVSSVSF